MRRIRVTREQVEAARLELQALQAAGYARIPWCASSQTRRRILPANGRPDRTIRRLSARSSGAPAARGRSRAVALPEPRPVTETPLIR